MQLSVADLWRDLLTESKKQEEHGVPRTNTTNHSLRNAVKRSSLAAVITSKITQTQEECDMFLNKDYEVPFKKEYVALFFLQKNSHTVTGCIDWQVTY